MKVPVYDTAQVAPGTSALPSVQGLGARELAELRQGPQQLQDLGRAAQGFANEKNREMVDAQAMANQVRVDDALNKVRQQSLALTYDPEQGYLNKKGSAALDPDPEGKALPQSYGAKLQQSISETASSLNNEAQRRAFLLHANDIHTQFTGGVERHMLQEYTKFGLETQQGTVDLAAEAAKTHWHDPDQIGPQIESAKAAVWKAGKINGEPANLTQAKITQTTSKIHLGVIDAALTNNEPEYAMAYINAKKGEMTADDLLKAQSVVKSDMRARTATSVALDAMQVIRPKLNPTDFDRVVNITIGSESGGNPNAVSPKGAKGIMQVMDGTNADPGYGVAPAKDGSPEERARVGRDYLKAMISNYGGDMAKAWAAYNAGPGAVDSALRAAKNEHNGQPGNWLALLPKETQKYVASNIAALNGGAGTPPLPSQQDVHDAIRTKLGPNADPKVLAAALQEGTRQFTDAMNARKAEGESAVTAAQRWLVQNDGNFAALPPDMRQAVVDKAPDKFDNLSEFAKKVAKGEHATNDGAYLDAVAHPEELAKMSDATFNHFAVTNFSHADMKHIADLRQSYLTGKANDSIESLNRPALNEALKTRMESIGVNPNPKMVEDKARVGAVQKFVSDGIYREQQHLGRKMTAQEVGDYVDRQLAANVELKGMLYGTNVKAMFAMKAGDIPGTEKDQIRAAFAQSGNPNPTEDQMLRAYWRVKGGR